MGSNNCINNNAISLIEPSFIGINYATAYANISTGSNTVIYTCPTGKRAFALSCMVCNPTGSPINAIPYLRSGGVDYQLRQILTINANTSVGEQSATNTAWDSIAIILEPGESIVFNGNGLNVFICMYEYASNVPVFTAKNLTLSSSSNVLYTVPTGKQARIGINSTGIKGLFYKNNGAARTVNCYIVPNGGAAGATNLYGTSNSANLQIFGGALCSTFVIDSGDFIQIDVTATGNAIAWANIWELG